MIAVKGMNGQWIGTFGGSTPGQIVLNIDELDGNYVGVAFLFNDDSGLPATAAGFGTPDKSNTFEIRTSNLSPVDPHTLVALTPEQLKTRSDQFSQYADVKGALNEDVLTLSWKTDIGIEGNCALERSKAGNPSELESEAMDWRTFKQRVSELLTQRQIFRGQREIKRLRTSYHRLGRAEISRFVGEDLPMALKKLSARTKHVFNIERGEENGAFLNLLQHHGYPTPLLDWTYSPYVAAFFAYRGISNCEAETSSPDRKVRVFVFDEPKWRTTFSAYMQLFVPKLHVTLAEFHAIENERLIPQQAVTMVTNIDDIETYIMATEVASGQKFLRAIDLPLSERRCVVRELSYMGITAGSMFPGLDGACEELKERNFDF